MMRENLRHRIVTIVTEEVFVAGRLKTRVGLVTLAHKREEVRELLEVGTPLPDVAKRLDVPYQALTKFLDQTEQAGLYARAREKAADLLATETLAIADDALGEVARDRLRVDARRWLAGRWDPARFADRAGVAVQVNLGDLHLTAVKASAEALTHEPDRPVYEPDTKGLTAQPAGADEAPKPRARRAPKAPRA